VAERVGKEAIKRERGYLYYLGKDGYLWKTPTKLNKAGKKARVGTEVISREDGYMYFLDKKGFVSRAKMLDIPDTRVRDYTDTRRLNLATLGAIPVRRAPFMSLLKGSLQFGDWPRAERFYRAILGPIRSTEPASTSPTLSQYFVTNVQPGMAIIRGFDDQTGEPATRFPTALIRVVDLEWTVAQVVENGGHVIHPKATIGIWGSVAYVTDPEGNLIELWESPRS
jgi:predicted enzyme related to lactoylglutathione lyase